MTSAMLIVHTERLSRTAGEVQKAINDSKEAIRIAEDRYALLVKEIQELLNEVSASSKEAKE